MRYGKYTLIKQHYMIGHSTGSIYAICSISQSLNSRKWKILDNTFYKKLEYYMNLGEGVRVYRKKYETQ